MPITTRSREILSTEELHKEVYKTSHVIADLMEQHAQKGVAFFVSDAHDYNWLAQLGRELNAATTELQARAAGNKPKPIAP